MSGAMSSPALRLKPPSGPVVGADGLPVTAWLVFIEQLCDRLAAAEAKEQWLHERLSALEGRAP